MKIIKNNTGLITVIICLLLIVVSISYAFFGELAPISSFTESNVNSGHVEYLSFAAGNEIKIETRLSNFIEGGATLSGETISSAKLIGDSSKHITTRNYNVYFYIDVNEYIYTQDDKTSEVLLNVIGPDGDEVSTITNFNYVTVSNTTDGNSVSGFDITDFKGLINIAEDFEISTDSEITQEWKVKISFVNLNANQIDNEGKVLSSRLILLEDELDISTNKILSSNGGIDSIVAKSEPNFSLAATTDEGMFAAPDDYGTSYYFRGTVDDNWVYFGGYYWRILRINGDNSVRLIYNGTTAPVSSQLLTKNIETTIGVAYFTPWGYMTASSDLTNLANAHKNEANSSIKTLIDNWFSGVGVYDSISNKLVDESLYISDTIFCNDRTKSTIDVDTNWNIEWASMQRNINKNFTFVCPDQRDAFTVNDGLNGNSSLKYPVGLVSFDELVMSGLPNKSNNPNHFLNSDVNYLSMTTGLRTTASDYYHWGYINNSWSNILRVDIGRTYYKTPYNNGVRPVINIKGDILFEGSGTWDDPYKIFE